MRVAGLFSGIGGLELGLARAGLKAQFMCEIWDPAIAVLRAHHPHVEIHPDIRTLSALPSSVEVVAAGFPCQDLSQAGRTAGIDGSRSGLINDVFRLLEKSSANIVLLENVPFMLNLNGGRAVESIAAEFERRGFRWAYRVINSLAFVPQRRERVFFLATRGDMDPAEVLLSEEAQPKLAETNIGKLAHGFYWTEGVRGLGWAPDATPPLKNGSTVGIASPPAILLPDGLIVKPDIRDAERLQGFEVDWTKQAEALARPSLRWSLVGNAVTVDVAEWLGRKLNHPTEYHRERDKPFGGKRGWPRAARFDGATRWSVEINDYPLWRERPPLHRFMKFPATPLSVRATLGFYNRTMTAKLRFPDGFLEKVSEHLRHMEAVANIQTRELA